MGGGDKNEMRAPYPRKSYSKNSNLNFFDISKLSHFKFKTFNLAHTKFPTLNFPH